METNLNENKMPFNMKHLRQVYSRIYEGIHRYLEQKTSAFVDAPKLLELK